MWASRHTKEIAEALAERLGPIEVKPPSDPEASLAAFTVPGMAAAVWGMIEDDLKEDGRHALHRELWPAAGGKGALRVPASHHCALLFPEAAIAKKEFMYPFSTVVECPQDQF